MLKQLRLASECLSTRLLVLLLATDVIFMLLHILHKGTPWLGNSQFAIDQERSYSEFFQYTKTGLLAGFMMVLSKTRSRLFWVWAGIFLFILADDSLALHEWAGEQLSAWGEFVRVVGLRSVDFGELLFLVTMAIIFFLSLLSAHRRCRDLTAKPVSRQIFACVAVLGIFGTVVDMLHVMVAQTAPRFINGCFTLLEDGGELMVMSFILAFVWRLVSEPGFRLKTGLKNSPA
jgi:hypothetical protein